MIPGGHVPPALPLQQGRRQSDYHYQYPPPQTHSPVPPHPYYHPPPQHYHPHAPHYAQPWYPPYQQPQYTMPPRPYQQPHYPPHAPLVVSSHSHGQPMTPVSRQQAPPPIVGHAMMQQPPLVPPQGAPPTPPVMQPRKSPAPSNVPAQVASPSPAPSQSSAAEPAIRTPPSASTPAPAPVPVNAEPTAPVVPAQPQNLRRMPSFTPPLPWLSRPDEPFPPPISRRRRKRKEVQTIADPVELPTRTDVEPEEAVEEQATEDPTQSQASTIAAPSDMETPATSIAPSETDSTHPTTPITSQPQHSAARTPTGPSHTRTPTRPVVPITPALPNIPSHRKQSVASTRSAAVPEPQTPAAQVASSEAGKSAETTVPETSSQAAEPAPAVTSPSAKPAPKSWADLVRSKGPANPASAVAPVSGGGAVNGSSNAKAASLAEVLRAFSVESQEKLAFLEPRGLVNTGNMCYMNSVLQVLVALPLFWTFLDQVGKRATHSFKNETPLLEAMIMFMREFKIIDSAVSAEQLRLRLKDNELEQYGEPFAPEFVYEVIRRLPRFSSMRRGHQQDAEEFLGFLLEGLHDECVQALRTLPAGLTSPPLSSTTLTPPMSPESGAENGWLEVGPKQKASITRSSGTTVSDSPVTKIFGGKLRSELRVPGLKNSVTLEPYQPLQLDIGAPQISNITDALKNLTKPETLHGDFNSPRGPNTAATKQVFIESLPPVLILHLKRFEFDRSGGTQKIWKKVGYPLDLEIPKEVFSPHKRSQIAMRPGGLPRYRLTAVVYHHGKNASGGHYTVDVRRQEGSEWIRIDDTVIRRVRSSDVAHEGGEEDPQVLKRALEQHKRDDASAKRNMFEGMLPDEDDEEGKSEADGWSQVNGSGGNAVSGQKKWSGVVANGGSTTPSTAGNKTPRGGERNGITKDRVAYILFYQQVK